MTEISQKPNEKDMWGCMFAGDLAIKKIVDKAIIVIGEGKVGKSTLFYHMLKFPMIGAMEKTKATKATKNTIYYELMFDKMKEKGISHSKTSESTTLIPNIERVTISAKQMSLCDVASLTDEKTNHIQTFGEFYMLQQLLGTAKEIKIILVLSHAKFNQDQMAKIFSPIVKFVSLLNSNVLLNDQDKAEKVFDSIAIVVSKAEYDSEYYLGTFEEDVIPFLTNETNCTSNERKLVLKLLQNICKNNRLQVFKKAADNIVVEETTILQNLSKSDHNWKFYNLKDNAADPFFIFKFQADFKKMDEKQRTKYKNISTTKKQFIKSSLQILKQFINYGKQKWHQQSINYQDLFKQLQQTTKNQPYGQLKLMLQHLNMKLQTPSEHPITITRLDLITKLQDIYNSVQKIIQSYQNVQQKTYKKIQIFIDSKHLYFNLFNNFKHAFCQNRNHEQIWIVFMFMNIRAIQQLLSQCTIDENPCAQFPQMIKNGIQQIFSQNIVDLRASFALNFKQNKTQTLKYRQFVKKSAENQQEISNKQQGTQLSYLNICNNIKQAQQQMRTQLYKQAIQKLLQTYQLFQQYISLLSADQQQKSQIKQKMQFKQLQIYMEMAHCFQELQCNSCAIKIYQYIRAIHSLLKCNQRRIIQTTDISKKITLMQDYATQLAKYGKKQRLIKLYQSMIDLSICFPSKRTQFADKLRTALEMDASVSDYQNILSENKQITYNQQLITNIKDELNDLQLLPDIPPVDDQQQSFQTYLEKKKGVSNQQADDY